MGYLVSRTGFNIENKTITIFIFFFFKSSDSVERLGLKFQY